MSPEFKPPASESEFKRRAEVVTLAGAQGVIKSLERRKAALIKPIDDEIAFYEKVITYKTNGTTS